MAEVNRQQRRALIPLHPPVVIRIRRKEHVIGIDRWDEPDHRLENWQSQISRRFLDAKIHRTYFPLTNSPRWSTCCRCRSCCHYCCPSRINAPLVRQKYVCMHLYASFNVFVYPWHPTPRSNWTCVSKGVERKGSEHKGEQEWSAASYK